MSKRKISLLLILLFSAAAWALEPVVHLGTEAELHHEDAGWRVHLLDPKIAPFGGLEEGDVVRSIAGVNAAKIGPLGILATLGSAKPVPYAVVVIRKRTKKMLIFWTEGGNPPPPRRFPKSVNRGFSAPTVPLQSTNGQPLPTRAGRSWQLINFWGTWCAPCRAELPELEFIVKARTAEVVGLTAMDDDAAINTFLKKHPLPYPVANGGDKNSRTLQEFGLVVPGGAISVPATVIARPGGEIAYVQSGFDPAVNFSQLLSNLKNDSAHQRH